MFALRLSFAYLLQKSANIDFYCCGYGYWMSKNDIKFDTTYSFRFFLGSNLISFSIDSMARNVSFINLIISFELSYIWQVAQLLEAIIFAGLISRIFLKVSIASLKFPS
jgi:hypothetical protein